MKRLLFSLALLGAFFGTPISATQITGPYTYGSQLVVTTDIGPSGPGLLMYTDANQISRPLGGTVTASVCIEQEGPQGQDGNSQGNNDQQ
jgi:hypothetical protein